MYQIYPRSFADGSGDGIGDLPGITSRLGALAELGVDAIWLSPFFTSPQADAGYDVADYRGVDPLFGTLSDFDALLARAHELGLKVIIDLVPNHSSDEHPWFQAALAAAPGSAERARYLFRDGKGPDGAQPPNNWTSIFGGIGWTRVTEADGRPGQWYLHMFDPKQPDWNWSNAEVRAEFRSVLRFWLDRGVDGFRVDVANSLVKKDDLPDYDPSADAGGVMAFGTPDGDALVANLHTSAAPMWDQEGVHEVYRDWRHDPGRVLTGPDPGRRGLGAAAVPAGPLRAPGRDAPGVQLRVPVVPVGSGQAARSDHRLARGQPQRRARRPPGCCPITTCCGTRPASDWPTSRSGRTASAWTTRSPTPNSACAVVGPPP